MTGVRQGQEESNVSKLQPESALCNHLVRDFLPKPPRLEHLLSGCLCQRCHLLHCPGSGTAQGQQLPAASPCPRGAPSLQQPRRAARPASGTASRAPHLLFRSLTFPRGCMALRVSRHHH